jgi:octaprenyl-diphosphate synthase
MYWNDAIESTIVHDVYSDITNKIISSHPIVDRILKKIFSHRGKGIRPLFMSHVADMVGGSWDSVRDAGVIIEAIHIASLIHDDVVDGSKLRRGSTTLNASYSEKASVLFGDYIFMKALRAAHSMDNSYAVSIIDYAVERMIEGEIRDTLVNHGVDEESYLATIRDKTASLFAASGELGVVLSGDDGQKKEWARELGETVGMVFQIIDDTLDFNGNSELMGKPTCIDVMTGHATLPLVYSLREMPDNEIRAFLENATMSCEDLSAFVKTRGGIDYAYRKAKAYSQKALEIVERFDSPHASNSCKEFIAMLMDRHW